MNNRDSYSIAEQPKLTNFQRKLLKLGYTNYRDYLLSEHWKKKRLHIFVSREKVCYLCKTTEHLIIHHKTYARLGDEQDKDLEILCDECHRAMHEWGREHKKIPLRDLLEAYQFRNEPKKSKKSRRKKKKKHRKVEAEWKHKVNRPSRFKLSISEVLGF